MQTVLTKINDLIVMVMDPLLGWILWLPRDLSILVLAFMTSFGIVLVRRWTTDQTYLNLCHEDRKRLKTLIKEAKKNKDKEALKRYRTTQGQIGLKLMYAEGKPLLAAIIPVALLATWAFIRMPYLAPEVGETVLVSLNHPNSSKGELVHLVPHENIIVANGWIQEFEQNPSDPLSALATWEIVAEKSGDFPLTIRSGKHSFEHQYQVGRNLTAPAFQFSDIGPLYVTISQFRERKLFGVVPGITAIAMPAWLIGYLVLTIVMVFVNKKLLRLS